MCVGSTVQVGEVPKKVRLSALYYINLLTALSFIHALFILNPPGPSEYLGVVSHLRLQFIAMP